MDDSILDEPSTLAAPGISNPAPNRPEATSDIADTFNLFKSYLDSKLENLKDQLSTGNDYDSLAKQIKKYPLTLITKATKFSSISIQKY